MFTINTPSPALIDGDTGQIITHQGLIEAKKTFPIGKQALIFIFNRNRLKDALTYVTAMNLGHVVCLLDGFMGAPFKKNLIDLYNPDFILDEELVKNPIARPKSFGKTRLLLTTSGTTGSPKLIRLSQQNIESNAQSIIESLQIHPNERAIASLPIHYSYGLSVLNSHLMAGASIVLTQTNPTLQPFWDVVNTKQCTSLAGVPYTYKILERVGFLEREWPTLRTLTQAGGALDPSLVKTFQQKINRFFVMYGQTEATARISYLPPRFLPEKAGSIGIAIPGGKLSLFDGDREIDKPREVGELVYSGPNVALGYATTLSDLESGDDFKGVLRTGDLGYFDQDNFFFVTGRLNRLSKIYGLRINLDDIEKAVKDTFGHVAVTGNDTQINIFIENGSSTLCEKCIAYLANLYQLHPNTFQCFSIDELPRTSSGKIDYAKLKRTDL